MLKKLIRAAIRRARKWLEEESGRKKAFDEDESLYPLNSLHRKIMAQCMTKHPAYAWGVLQGVNLAKALGIGRVSVLEFGVAGGKGLIALEEIAEKVEAAYGVGLDVYGFDTGIGLPKPQDYRDIPNRYSEGYFPMDHERLQRRLKRAHLILGLVGETIQRFIEGKPSPVAFISFDMDLYSSTVQAFRLFDADQQLLLPRVHCYFDDIMGFSFGDFNGERLAISEFNASHSMRKISPVYGLRYFISPRYRDSIWTELFYIAHFFDHELYGCKDGLAKRTRLDIPAE
jgi:hypothetical protein